MIEHIISKSTLDKTYDFQAGTMLLIDKPKDWTSFDVVNKLRGKLRYHLQTKKIKVGHAGTLDPMATGLLLVCTGKYTKQIDTVQAIDKVYTAEVTLGATTPSYDAESDIDQHYSTSHITASMIIDACQQFTGDIEQIPPMYSAIKINGQPLYKLARKGKTVERKARPVTIHSIEILSIIDNKVTIRVACTKGTYIRSLAYDLGQSLHSGAYLTALRRDAIGQYRADEALDVLAAADWIEANQAFKAPTES